MSAMYSLIIVTGIYTLPISMRHKKLHSHRDATFHSSAIASPSAQWGQQSPGPAPPLGKCVPTIILLFSMGNCKILYHCINFEIFA